MTDARIGVRVLVCEALKCRYCGLVIAPAPEPRSEYPRGHPCDWIHIEGWSNGGYTHEAGQVMCEPDMQTTIATPLEHP